MYPICLKGKHFYPLFDKNYGFSTCASNVFFPIVLFVLALLRVITLRRWSFKKSKLELRNPPALRDHNQNLEDLSEVNILAEDGNLTNGEYPIVNLRRKSKFPVLYQVFLWLNILYPLNYVFLMVAHLNINREFSWIWPVLLTSTKLAWWLTSYALKCETTMALNLSNKLQFSHSFLILCFWFVAFLFEMIPLINMGVSKWHYEWSKSLDKVDIFLSAVRSLYVLIILCIGFYAPGLPKHSPRAQRRLSDVQNLVSEDENDNDFVIDYERSTFKNSFKKLKLLWPFMWPKREPLLQISIVLAFASVMMIRVAKVAVPIFYSKVVSALSEKDISQIPWHYLAFYSFFYFMTDSGFLSDVRTFLWIKVELYTARKLLVDIFQHMHNLPPKWHLGTLK